jgi:hypothetical protein
VDATHEQGSAQQAARVRVLVVRSFAVVFVRVSMEVTDAVVVFVHVQVNPSATEPPQHVGTENDEHHADERFEHSSRVGR